MANSIFISIVIPLCNEEVNINELSDRLIRILPLFTTSYEILLINDGSTDATLQKIKELAGQNPCIKYISFSRNFGHQVAVSAGLDHCRGQAVVIMDGDLQDPPELIPEMYKKYKEGYDVVYAKRTRRNGESWFKKATAKLFYRILQRFTSFNIPLDAGDFRLIDRKVVEMLRQMPEQNKFLRGQIAWMGFRQTYVEFERDARRHGKTGYPFKKMLDLPWTASPR
jgi:polyisoprenyl-phosphate glycosyltransferase